MHNVNQSNIVTSGYASTGSGNLAYSLESQLSSSGTSIEIKLSVYEKSSFLKLTLSTIRTSISLLIGNAYLILFEVSSSGPENLGSISIPDFTGY